MEVSRVFSWSVLLAVGSYMVALGAEPVEVNLWPGEPPGTQVTEPEKFEPARDGIHRLTNVGRPRIVIYRPSNPTGAAILVCPGGAYSILAISHEGTEVCQWLNEVGVTAALLYYRVPGRRDEAFMDALRAMGLLRQRAAEWGLDRNRIGILGFSAGGHLAARVSSHSGGRTYPRLDEADDLPSRPDAAVLVYPAYLLDTNAPPLGLILPAGAHCPPTFLVHAADDRIPAFNSVAWFVALRQAGVPAELHIYEQGGHGFGMKTNVHGPVKTWTARCTDWLVQRGWARPQSP